MTITTQDNVYYTTSGSGREFPPTPELLAADFPGCFRDIEHEFLNAQGSAAHGLVLQIHHACVKVVAHYLDGEDLEAFTKKATKDYEDMIAHESRGPDGAIDYATLERVTWREVEAGRLSPDNWMRVGAVAKCIEIYEDLRKQDQPKATWRQRLACFLRGEWE